MASAASSALAQLLLQDLESVDVEKTPEDLLSNAQNPSNETDGTAISLSIKKPHDQPQISENLENDTTELVEGEHGDFFDSLSNLIGDKKFENYYKSIDEKFDYNNESKENSTLDYINFSRSNLYALEIENELSALYIKLTKIYAKRFPELASLILDPDLYAQTIDELQNDISSVKSNINLPNFLQNSTIMVIGISAASSKGQNLNKKDLEKLNAALKIFKELKHRKNRLLGYVESRLSHICPNLNNLVGSNVATKLLSAAGGLKKLSQIPSCNLHLIGAEKQLTVAGGLSHSKKNGIVYETDLVTRTNPDFIKQAVKQVCNKISLAVRCDLYQPVAASHDSQPSGEMGIKFRQQITHTLERLQEPLWQSQFGAHEKKALPVPSEPPRRRRGGRRARKSKEMMGMTAIREQSNRMNFGSINEDITQLEVGKDFGNLTENAKSGKVRMAPTDVKTKAKISRTLQQKLNKENSSAQATFSRAAGNATVLKQQLARKNSGTASSVVFTPMQGLEIVINNKLQDESALSKEDDGYFSSLAQFKKPKI